VRHPGGEEFTQCDRSELRMPAPAMQVPGPEPERLESDQVCRAKLGEGVEELVERLAPRRFELREAVERGERASLTMREQDLSAGDPVGPFPVDQVAYYIEGAPALRTFRSPDPRLRKVTQ
jgi:hypothetical protein